jgi:nucleoid DNA-binding protein
MSKTELAQALVTGGHVEREEDAEALLDALASIIWHALEHETAVEWPRVGTFGVSPADRRRRAVTFEPASELKVAVNRHHVEI